MTDSISYVNVLDRRLAVANKRTYGCFRGPSDVLFQTFQSNSFSNSSANITIDVPQSSVLYPRLYARVDVELTLTGTATVGPNLIPLDTNGDPILCSFRAYALDNATKTINMQLQNINLTENVNVYSNATFCHYSDEFDALKSDSTGCPLQADNCVDYTLLDNSVKSVHAPYGDNVYEDSRASFPVTVVSNTPTSAVIRTTLIAPVKCAPLSYGNDGTVQGMYGVKQINLQTIFDGNLAARLWSASPALNITASVANITGYAVTAQMMTVSPEMRATFPSTLVLPYYQTVPYSTRMTEVPSGGVGTVTSAAINMNVIPNCMYLWIGRRDADKTINTTETAFRITNLNITYNGKAGLLSTATEWEIYNICQQNGITRSLREFSARNGLGCGSFVRLQFGKDIVLPQGQVPGMAVSSTIQVTVQYENTNPLSAITPDLNMVMVNEGVLLISDINPLQNVGTLSAHVGVVDEMNLAFAEDVGAVWSSPKHVLGGGLWDVLKNIGSSLASFGRSVLPGARMALESPAVQQAFAEQMPRFAPYAQRAAEASQFSREKLGYGGRKISRRKLKY